MIDSDRTGIEVPEIYPLDCVDLRTMATMAAAMVDRGVTFTYDGATGAPHITAGAAGAPGPGRVVIPTWTRSRHGDLAEIQVSVAYVQEGETGVMLLDGVSVDATSWDAAFWSESAVEKFLVPYLATLGGPRAEDVIRRVLDAWNRYPAEMRVFGLLRRAHPAGGAELGVDTLVDVAYVDLAAHGIYIRPLGEFLLASEAPTEPASEDLPSTGRRPVPFPAQPGTPQLAHRPSELVLRRMAEWASACRSQPVCFVYDANQGTFGAPVPLALAAGEAQSPDRVAIPVQTARTRSDRPVVTRVILRSRGGAEQELGPDAADATFWGSGSVEQMMIPYYASVYGAGALPVLGRIYDAWWNNDASVTPDETVYAMVHLPKSDWDPEAEVGSAVLSHVGMVLGSGDARSLWMRPLSAGAGTRRQG